MTDRGDHTEDLRRHATIRADPDTLEARTRRWGRIGVIVGLTLCVATVVESLGMAAATENGLFQSEAGRLFGSIAFFAQLMVGGFILGNGYNEMRDRPNRERHRRMQLLVERLTVDNGERFQEMAGMVMALPHAIKELTERIDALEQGIADIPNYGRGVIDGVQMRQEVFGDEVGDGRDRD